ncbi:MAG: hypothetical protein ACRDWB_06510 [Acidimicrobiales bacterium]
MTNPREYRPYAVGGALYLGLSLVIWWHVGAHPASTTTCGCGDAALTLWVIDWPAHAIAHGQNLFYSSQLFHPQGINMVPNSLALGVVLAPVTWLFGPVASMNVIDLVSPPLSALAMFWLLRRWVPWSPAAWVGGLFFGFSPFVMVSLAFAHPNFGLLALLPLMVACLDDLFVRHAHPPRRVGVALGLLVVVEFFISVEVLLLVVLFVVLAAIVACIPHLTRGSRHWWAAAVGPGAVGLGVAAGVAAVLLAYPLWYFFEGPAHLVGRAWPNSPSGTVGNTLSGFATGQLPPSLVGILRLFGGYQGPPLPNLSFVGIGVLVVVAVGVVAGRRDRRLWLFGSLGVVAAVLSLGVGQGAWRPWRLFAHLPVLNNVVPVNLTVITDLCVAVMLGIIVGHAHDAAIARWDERRAAGAGGVVAALALVPVAVALWPNLPMTIRPMVVPGWFTSTAARLPTGQVVLPYPAAVGGIQSSMAWQAVAGIPFSLVGGGGPGVTVSRAGPETPGFEVLAAASLPLGPPPQPTAANLEAVRSAMTGWGVTTVVVPDQPQMPTYNQGRGVPYAVGLFAAALGQTPVHQAGAWVWTRVVAAGPPVVISPDAFQGCIGGPAGSAPPPASTVAACVLHRP